MSVILGSTGITFPDSTTQTTAATSSGGTVTSVATGTGLTGGTITTSGTISLVTTQGAVGTYAMCLYFPGSLSPGSTAVGSNLYYSNAGGAYLSSPQPSGTWKCMGFSSSACGYTYQVTLFLRIA
jgi:hypothetical protein